VKKSIIILIILFLSFTATCAQELRLVVDDKPLNTVLGSLNVEISFNDHALSQYRVTVSRTFASPGEAINYLLHDKPFKLERIGNVFVITPVVIAEKNPEPLSKRNTSFRANYTTCPPASLCLTPASKPGGA